MGVCLVRIIESLSKQGGSLRKIDLSGNPISSVIPNYEETIDFLTDFLAEIINNLPTLEGFDISGMLLGSSLV